MSNKKCACCKQYKPTEQYSKDKYRVDGLTTYCKQCSRMKQKEYRNHMSEEQREYRRKYNREIKKKDVPLPEGYISLLKQIFKE